MPYPQDLVGKYIDYRVDPGGNMGSGMAGMLVDGVLPGQTTAAAVAVYTAGAPVPGQPLAVQNTVPWNFTFLKYFCGAVTTASLAGAVLTGPMSGCYLCRYTRGGQNLAHIGTANAQDSEASIAVKAAWRTFEAREDVSVVEGGTPFDYFPTSEFQAAMLSPSRIPMVVGYFDAGSAYSMLLAPVPGNMNPAGLTLLKVAAVKTMTLQPWATIGAMRTFRG